MTEICFRDAVDLAAMIRNREVSASEVMTAFLSQIKRLGPGDPGGDDDEGPGPGDPGEAELQPLLEALQRRGKALGIHQA